ncbi:TetR family transcriptional regulator [Stenotrophomonas sp. Betaine-02u-21]|uniref:TetR/AcrR family transcriptional regulator n=1 Tax=unclassified Stenotrophomonas TaxID=196198 RepID=UPI000C32D6DD|nr:MULTISPECIES: TetR/AcrR family transcriptional regulator [unclassified Stenotrophomonas]PKH70512.1 TetR family transcriptional regulator [Stenotrophomonas sp. Betaine-02u-23]PKH75820.1 TetR family transcriptional regulator [Stenotrophomonas sp. Betaine-02u-21]PKH95592.1 TetR family transcriptional regulator [Stenotrophomonas sp. Bg11-02]
MAHRQPDVRRRVVAAAAEMLARHGLNATSIREMTKRADAPFGSTYHHFPGGKQQVVVEAVQLAGARTSAGLERHLQAGPAAGLRGFLAMWRDILLKSDFCIGCPVMGAAVEAPIDGVADDVLEAAAQAFDDWESSLVASLETQGRDRESASCLATLIVASVEGAIVLCRARRSIVPFDRIAAQLEALVSTA